MARPRRRDLFLGLVVFVALWALPVSGQKGAASGQWRAYRGDEASTA